MSIQISQVIFQMGTEPARDFAQDCREGDWEMFRIKFPNAFNSQARIRIIATANNIGIDREVNNPPLVCVVQRVTAVDFTVATRNSDCVRGSAGINWMAVAETPGEDKRRITVRIGVVTPKHFAPNCGPGDSQSWGVNFGTPFQRVPVALLTPSNLNVRNHNAAAVGIVRDVTPNGFTLRATNSDCAEGDSAFYYIALSDENTGSDDLVLDSGEVVAQGLSSDCVQGDWRTWDISFSQSFLTPPFVMLTANDLQIREGYNAAVVGIAQNVTTHGFTLAARNSDCTPGEAGFYWVAIGCAKGCG